MLSVSCVKLFELPCCWNVPYKWICLVSLWCYWTHRDETDIFQNVTLKWSCVFVTCLFNTRETRTEEEIFWERTLQRPCRVPSVKTSLDPPQSCYWWLTTVTTGGIIGGQTVKCIRPGCIKAVLPDRLLPARPLNPTAALPHALKLEWHPFSPKHWSLPLPLHSWAMKHQNNLNTKVPTRWNKVFWGTMLNAESLNHFMSQQDDKLYS